jgi:thymidylate synthase
MGVYDNIYHDLVSDIIQNGIWDKDQKVRTKWADGTPAYTKSIISKQIVFDNSETPILTTKKVAWKTAIKELLWIWQQKDNDVDNLNKQGVKIWDEWKQDDGTIGKAYGYQLGKECRAMYAGKDLKGNSTYIHIDQVDYLLHQLQLNPSSRRHITSLWSIEDLDDMALNPCVWATQWLVKEGKLHLIVQVRSNDIALGQPFNVFQYYVLQRMIAQVTNYEMGTLTFNINDLHAYERHLDALTEQINRESYEAPILWVNPDVEDFYDFTIDDFKLIDYKHGETIRMEVAI